MHGLGTISVYECPDRLPTLKISLKQFILFYILQSYEFFLFWIDNMIMFPWWLGDWPTKQHFFSVGQLIYSLVVFDFKCNLYYLLCVPLILLLLVNGVRYHSRTSFTKRCPLQWIICTFRSLIWIFNTWICRIRRPTTTTNTHL